MPSLSYFACGSNMLCARLLERRVALLDGWRAAQLHGYRLAFNKASKDGSSKANLMPEASAASWGVLFTVDASTLAGLVAAEGAPAHYGRATVLVETAQGQREAMTYLARPEKLLTALDQPWDWYLALIIVGAKSCTGIADKGIRHIRRSGRSKPSNGQPPKPYAQATAQLKAAGHERWQGLLDGEGAP